MKDVFYFIGYDGKNDLYDAYITSLDNIVEHILSDDDYFDLMYEVSSYDEYGDPDNYQNRNVSEEELLDSVDGVRIDGMEYALEYALRADVNYRGVLLTKAIRETQADPYFVVCKKQVEKLMHNLGWKTVRDENNSIYFSKSDGFFDHVKVRFSDHALGTDWTGRQQTGGALHDVVWEKGMTPEEVISHLNDTHEE